MSHPSRYSTRELEWLLSEPTEDRNDKFAVTHGGFKDVCRDLKEARELLYRVSASFPGAGQLADDIEEFLGEDRPVGVTDDSGSLGWTQVPAWRAREMEGGRRPCQPCDGSGIEVTGDISHKCRACGGSGYAS